MVLVMVDMSGRVDSQTIARALRVPRCCPEISQPWPGNVFAPTQTSLPPADHRMMLVAAVCVTPSSQV